MLEITLVVSKDLKFYILESPPWTQINQSIYRIFIALNLLKTDFRGAQILKYHKMSNCSCSFNYIVNSHSPVPDAKSPRAASIGGFM